MCPKTTVRMMLLATTCFVAGSAQEQNTNKQDALTNKDIIVMTGSGMSGAIIKAAIGKSKTNFDLSAAGLIQLKKSGIPDDILLSMISKVSTAAATAPEDSLRLMPPGIYNRSVKGYRPVEGHVLLSEISKGAVGSLKKTLSAFMNFVIKADMSGNHAELCIEEAKPLFVFILDYPARNPDEFFLVKLIQSNKTRQICFQKTSGASGYIAVSDTLKIAFKSKKIQEGIYEISPIHPLQPGEYCFLYNASSLYKGNSFKGFDFGVGEHPNTPHE